MEKFVTSLIAVEKSIQFIALVGVILFLGYLGFTEKLGLKPRARSTAFY
jgi:hypothetical protein